MCNAFVGLCVVRIIYIINTLKIGKKNMKRLYFNNEDLRLSFVDFEGDEKPILLCLHGHFGNARTFSKVAEALKDWHVYALDQRGHGWSDHADSSHYKREDYIQDIEQFVSQVIDNKPMVILGHSLGGVNAYQFAAKHKDNVSALIIEDIGTEVNDDLSFAQSFIDTASTLEALSENLKNFGINDSRYFLESAFETDTGWHFRFDKNNLPISQESLNGIWWDDFLTTDCPTILLHGRHSNVVSMEQIEWMVDKRINTTYHVFENSGHAIHYDEPEQFIKIVSNFLKKI